MSKIYFFEDKNPDENPKTVLREYWPLILPYLHPDRFILCTVEGRLSAAQTQVAGVVVLNEKTIKNQIDKIGENDCLLLHETFEVKDTDHFNTWIDDIKENIKKYNLSVLFSGSHKGKINFLNSKNTILQLDRNLFYTHLEPFLKDGGTNLKILAFGENFKQNEIYTLLDEISIEILNAKSMDDIAEKTTDKINYFLTLSGKDNLTKQKIIALKTKNTLLSHLNTD